MAVSQNPSTIISSTPEGTVEASAGGLTLRVGIPSTVVSANVYANYTTNQFTTVATVNKPGGNVYDVQFQNPEGDFGGDADFTYNPKTNDLRVQGTIVADAVRTDVFQYANGAPLPVGYSNANVANYLATANIPSLLVGNLTVSGGVANLGSVTEVRIFGGSNGQVLTSNGGGGVFWSNITLTPGSNAIVNVLTANVGNITTINSNLITSNVINANTANIVNLTSNVITANTGNITTINSNLVTSNTIVANTGNITTVNSNLVNANTIVANTANISNLNMMGGNIANANVITANTFAGGNFTGNFVISNALSFNNSGTGAASGTSYNGSAVQTISWNTVGAASGNATGWANVGLGPVSNANVIITGGTAGQVLTTDGTGVLSWTTAAGAGTVTSVSTTQVDPSALGFTLTGGPITAVGTATLNVPTATALRTALNIGNVANANFDGNASNVLFGNGVWAPAGGTGTVTSVATATANTANTTASPLGFEIVGGPITATGTVTLNVPTVAQFRTNANIGNVANLNLDGNVSNVLKGDGTWGAAGGGGTPGGLTTEVQFNNAGVFGGISTATWNGTALSLGSNANVIITGGTVGQVLSTDGLGALSWISAATLPLANGTSNINIPAVNGNIEFGVAGNANVLVLSGNAANVTGGLTVNNAITQKYAVVAGSAIDCSTADYFKVTIAAPTTLTVTNAAASGLVTSFILEVVNGGTGVTWWAGVKWASGLAPTLTTSGTDILGFYTYDGGTTWRGLTLSIDSK